VSILTFVKFFKLFVRIFENNNFQLQPMFLNTNQFNEGGCREKCGAGRKRELQEGRNPKVVNAQEANSSTVTHVNARWQDLRK